MKENLYHCVMGQYSKFFTLCFAKVNTHDKCSDIYIRTMYEVNIGFLLGSAHLVKRCLSELEHNEEKIAIK